MVVVWEKRGGSAPYGGTQMLEDFNQEKQEQFLDPFPEETALPWNKKIVLFCVAIAFIGLFIFFTSDSWTGGEKIDSDFLAREIELLKERIVKLEQKTEPSHQVIASTTKPAAQPVESVSSSLDSLKSLIEQELQESVASVPEPAQPTKKQKKETHQYTVKKGDSLSGISQHFYGTSKRWKRIVEANKNVLGSNQMLKPGMVLVIPEEA